MSISQGIILISVALLGGGAVALIRELFRPPVGFEPHCRRCGYNLRGRNPSAGNCPECGSDLEQPRAIEVGRRVRRGGVIWSAVACLVIGAIPVGTVVVGWVDFRRATPFWVLCLDAASGDPFAEFDAATELHRRLDAGLLSGAQKRALADTAMRLPAGRAHRVGKVWQTMFQTLSQGGFVSDASLKRHLEERLTARILFRREVSDGQPIPFGFQYTYDGACLDPTLSLHEQRAELNIGDLWLTHDLASDVDDLPVTTSAFNIGNSRSVRAATGGGSMPWFGFEPTGYVGRLQPGLHHVAGTVTLITHRPGGGGTIAVSIPCQGDFELVARDDPRWRPTARILSATAAVSRSNRVPNRLSAALDLNITGRFESLVDITLHSSLGPIRLGMAFPARTQGQASVIIPSAVAQQLIGIGDESVRITVQPHEDARVRVIDADSPECGSATATLPLTQEARSLFREAVASHLAAQAAAQNTPVPPIYPASPRPGAPAYPPAVGAGPVYPPPTASAGGAVAAGGTVDLAALPLRTSQAVATAAAPVTASKGPPVIRQAPEWVPPWKDPDPRIDRLAAIRFTRLDASRAVIERSPAGTFHIQIKIRTKDDLSAVVLLRSAGRELPIGERSVGPGTLSISLPIDRATAGQIAAWNQDSITAVLLHDGGEATCLVETRVNLRRELEAYAAEMQREE